MLDVAAKDAKIKKTLTERAWHGQRRTTQARELLARIYHRFSEGLDTADLVTAKALLQSLR